MKIKTIYTMYQVMEVSGTCPYTGLPDSVQLGSKLRSKYSAQRIVARLRKQGREVYAMKQFLTV
jgi:hypothetical protein